MKKLPVVGVYLTVKEWKKQKETLELLFSSMSKKEKIMAVRIEGKIGFGDLQKILKGRK